jgi:hypothetical protein
MVQRRNPDAALLAISDGLPRLPAGAALAGSYMVKPP